MKLVLVILLTFTSTAFGQNYYPLSLSTRWYYQVSYSYFPPDVGIPGVDTTRISVVADSVVHNGKTFYTLDYGFGPFGNIIRADSVGVHFYESWNNSSVLVFRTTDSVGDTNFVELGPFRTVVLAKIETLQVFGFSTRVLHYKLDGIAYQTVALSDRFGPFIVGLYGDPPPPYPPIEYTLVGFSDDSGSYGYTTSVADGDNIPGSTTLFQNYPNPFNNSTTIEFSVADRSEYTLQIFNILGQMVWSRKGLATIAGRHQIRWDGSSSMNSTLPSGNYFVVLRTSTTVNSRTMTLLK